jgi:hypothetical protein
MENKDISQIALQRIKESGIKPISKKVFNIKRVIFWSLVGFSVVVGIVTFSVILSLLFNNEWYLYNKFGFNYVLKTLPYFWVGCLLLFIVLGEFYYRKTSLGYRHRTISIIGVYVVVTVALGTASYMFGIGEVVEQAIFDNVPVYRVVVFDNDEFWSHPESGLLAGKVIEVGDKIIKVVDLNGMIWNINIENTFIGKQAKIEVGQIIKIIGDQDKSIGNLFTANEIHL